MGAQQSSEGTTGSSPDSTGGRTCYYELLSVRQDASEDEIKRAYRRKALELHPDKNPEDIENATQRFADLQAAYEVLSDPQERAWYDSHKDSILRGSNEDDVQTAHPQFYNRTLTSSDDVLNLIKRFNSTIPFTDEQAGFYGGLRDMFSKLADEELAAAEHIQDGGFLPYPSFGFSHDSYVDVVKPFYSAWSGFTTKKSYAWADKYRLADAPDRKVRRLMEKENRKFREEAAREFNDAVRFLVSFTRRRDPRYLPNSQSDADRQTAMRNASAAQAARSRAANKKKLDQSHAPSWTPMQDYTGEDSHFAISDPESEIEHIECVVCNKIFKSEKQYEAHERSKKHLKAVQTLRRQMRKEGIHLDIDTTKSSDSKFSGEKGEVDEHLRGPLSPGSNGGHGNDSDSESSGNFEASSEKTSILTTRVEDSPHIPLQDLDISEHSSRSHQEIPVTEPATPEEAVGSAQYTADIHEARKTKTRRRRKEPNHVDSERSQDGFTCNACGEISTSRTQLFAHIRREGHATSQIGSRQESTKQRK